MLNGMDLFSGYGGISLALRDWVKPVLNRCMHRASREGRDMSPWELADELFQKGEPNE